MKLLLLSALLTLSTNALAAVEPESSDYPFTLEQALERAEETWLEQLLGPQGEEP